MLHETDQSEGDARELERKIDPARRIASTITDQTTLERLRAWIRGTEAELEATFSRPAAAQTSKLALESFGSKTASLQVVTWNFGFKPRLRLSSAIEGDRPAQQPLEFDVSLNVPILRSSCHSSTSRPSKSCLASLMASASSAQRRSTRF